MKSLVENEQISQNLKKVCLRCKEIFEIGILDKSKKVCLRCKEKEAEKSLKFKDVRKYVCVKCQLQFETDRVYLKCPHCKVLLFQCKKCKRVLERESALKIKYCKECEKTFISKEEIKKLLFQDFLTQSEICEKFNVPLSYVRSIDQNFQENCVECLVCKEQGIEFKKIKIYKHLKLIHNLNSVQYKALYNADSCSAASKRNHSQSIKKSWETGKYNGLCYVIDMNSGEKRLNEISERLVYVGANKNDLKRFFLRTKNKLRCPDFVVIDETSYLDGLKNKTQEEKQNKVFVDFFEKRLKIKKVIEYCGYGWHRQRFYDLTEQQYAQKITDDYKDIEIDCLVIWDYELICDSEFTKKRILDFTGEQVLIDDTLEKVKNKTNRCILCKNSLNGSSNYLCLCCEDKEKKSFKNCLEGFDFVECKICGTKRESLVRHVTQKHNIQTLRYQRFFKADTVCQKTKKKVNKNLSKSIKKLWDNEHYKKNSNFMDINNDENFLLTLQDKLVYTGGNKKGFDRFYIKTDIKKSRNPDFVIIDDEKYLKNLQDKTWFEKEDTIAKDFISKKVNIVKVVEYCCYLWHKNKFNGRTKNQYETDMINEYAKANVSCLIIWNDELKDVKKLKAKLETFVTN